MSTIKTDNEDLVLHAEGVKDVGIQTNGSTKLTVKSNGNVGIGTSNPSEKLQVAGDLLLAATNAEINLKSGVTGTSGGINWVFNSVGTNYASVKLNYDTRSTDGLHMDSGYPITIDATTRIRFAITGSEKMRINSDGIVTMPYQPSFKMVLSYSTNLDMAIGTSNISGWAYTEVIPKMIKEFDIGNNVTSMTDATGGQSYVKFTAPVTGVYHFCLNGGVRNLNSGDWTSIGLIKNTLSANVEEHYILWHSWGLSADSSSGSGVNIQLAANDYVVLSSQSVENTNLENKFGFSGHLIG